jgi:hypothetical protein
MGGPLHSPSGSSSQPLDFMGVGLQLDGEEEDTTGTGKPSATPLEMPDGQPGSWDGFPSNMDLPDTQDNSSRAGSCAPNFIRPGEQNFIKRQDNMHAALSEDENHPNNAVDYNPNSSEDEHVLEEQGPALELKPEMALTISPLPKPSAIGRDKGEAAAPRNSVVSAERKAVLDHSDILRMTSDKNYKFIRSMGNHEPQQAGLENSIYYFDKELDGYTSPGGTVRMTKGVANVVFIALATETPNTLLLKAHQEAYKQVTKQAEAQAKRQQEAYDEQQRRIAHEHEDHMTRMRQENDRMLKEAAEVRDQFARAFKIEPEPTISAIGEAQSRHYFEALTNQMGLRTQRLRDDYESEVKRRIRKEEDLKDAEAKIERLQKHLKALENMLEASAKRAVPARGQDDSPEMHAIKRSKVEEVNKDVTACTKQLESYKARGEMYNVKDNSKKEVIITSALPAAVTVKSERPKSTSPPCHEDLPRTGGLLAKGLDENEQSRFEDLKAGSGGPEMRRIQPELELWLDYTPGSSHSDHY